jgi:GcrA cell cycle regulator
MNLKSIEKGAGDARRGVREARREASAAWSEDRVERLRLLWSQGVSAGGVAKALGEGVSRSAVLGKLQRLGLLKSRRAAAAPRCFDETQASAEKLAAAFRLRRPRQPHREPPPSPWKAEAFRPLAGTAPRAWLTRGSRECAFPVDGEQDAAMACCAPRRARSAYCAAHHQIVFRPAPPLGPALLRAPSDEADRQGAAAPGATWPHAA